MKQLGMLPTGGRWGSITRLKDQVKRLFSASICCSYDNQNRSSGIHYAVAEKWDLWWDVKQPYQAALFDSTVTLGEAFFKEIINHPVPVDIRALKSLSKSPMALDIYIWMTYRMSYLTKPITIPWDKLQLQFGSDYTRTRDFKRYFLSQLKAVSIVYPDANVQGEEYGLLLAHSLPHIRKN
jgi:hypothetical protein